MEDLAIGAEIVLKVVETEKEQCNGCFFDEICNNIYENVCGDFDCSASTRKRNKSYNLIPCGLSFRISATLIFTSILFHSLELNSLSVFYRRRVR